MSTVPTEISEKRARRPVCAICRDFQRDGIDQMILEGGSYRTIAEQFSVSYGSVYRHVKAGHIQDRIVKNVNRKEVLNVNSIIESLLQTRSKAKQKSETVTDAYLAPLMRVGVEVDKTLLNAGFDMEKLKLERDKLDQKGSNSDSLKLTKAVDYMRAHHPDELQAFSDLVDGAK